MTTQISLNKITAISNKITMGETTEKSQISKDNDFYSRYSRFTLKALGRYRFQEFVNLMLKLEDIDEKKVNSIKIVLYPVRKQKGCGVAGTCNPLTGKIRIYPKNEKFCDVFSEKYGKILLITYAGNRARASLIHELLHLKYTSDEGKVRALTKAYFSKYIQETKDLRLGSLSVYNLIFGYAE
jgi:hypothetical protein